VATPTTPVTAAATSSYPPSGSSEGRVWPSSGAKSSYASDPDAASGAVSTASRRTSAVAPVPSISKISASQPLQSCWYETAGVGPTIAPGAGATTVTVPSGGAGANGTVPLRGPVVATV
jgi:hypothetical protein